MKILILLSLIFSTITNAERGTFKEAKGRLKALGENYLLQEAACDSAGLPIVFVQGCKDGAQKRIAAKIEQVFTEDIRQLERDAISSAQCIQLCQANFDLQEPPLAYNGNETCKQLHIAWAAAGKENSCR